MTPAGKPAWWTRSMMSCIAVGSCSDGFAIQQFPVATAYGQNQNCTMTGKLNGLIPANTPSGWDRASRPIPGPAPAIASDPNMGLGVPGATHQFPAVGRTPGRG